MCLASHDGKVEAQQVLTEGMCVAIRCIALHYILISLTIGVGISVFMPLAGGVAGFTERLSPCRYTSHTASILAEDTSKASMLAGEPHAQLLVQGDISAMFASGLNIKQA